MNEVIVEVILSAPVKQPSDGPDERAFPRTRSTHDQRHVSWVVCSKRDLLHAAEEAEVFDDEFLEDHRTMRFT